MKATVFSTLVLTLLLIPVISRAAPLWDEGRFGRYAGLRASFAYGISPKQIELEDAEKLEKKEKDDSRFFEVTPSKDSLKWAELSLIKVEDEKLEDQAIIDGLGAWFPDAKWQDEYEWKTVGLASRLLLVFPDDEQSGLVWILDFVETPMLRVGHKCGEGFVQYWPDTRLAVIDSKPPLSSKINELVEKRKATRAASGSRLSKGD